MSPSPDEIVAAARAWLGTPYRHQAATPGAGCDCLGLLRGVWRSLYGSEPLQLPPYRPDWRDLSHAESLQSAAARLLRPAGPPLAAGQIVLFRLNGLPLPKHCGIMVAETRFIHAQERLGVVEANLADGWRRRIAGAYEFPPSAVLAETTPAGSHEKWINADGLTLVVPRNLQSRHTANAILRDAGSKLHH